MSLNELLEYENEKFQQRIKGLREDDINWLINKIINLYPELKGYETDQDKKIRLYSRASSLLYGVEEKKPSDIRAYVEKELKKKDYDNKLSKLSDRINWNLFGNDKACAELRKEISSLLDEADKEFPGFSKARALQISEMSQRIMAYKTKGAVGHIGTVRAIREQLEKEERTRKNEKGVM